MSLSDLFFAPGQAHGGVRGEIRPFWLRPAALTAILVAHAAVFVTLKSRPETLAPGDVIAVTLAPLGDAAEDQKKQDEIAPATPPPASADATTLPPAEATPPNVVVPEAIRLPAAPLEPPKSVPTPRQKRVDDKRHESKRLEQARQEEMRKREELPERRRRAQQQRQELRRGVERGVAHPSSLPRATYASLVATEIRRHTFYPAAARAAGVTGVVGVAFTIGASGQLAALSVIRSSGNRTLDDAARTTLRSIHAPPPPDGRFSASANIRFHLN
jgi:periplasmic protein TonB